MSVNDYTLTSPLSTLTAEGSALLGLTIVWHPDTQRIGEQFVAASGMGQVELNRYAPLFRLAGAEGLPLGYGGISRESLQLRRDEQDGVTLILPASRMVVELNGVVVTGQAHLSADDIRAGAILGLGRAVLICLHWMSCLPKNNSVDGLLGVGSAAIMMRDQIRQVAGTELPVLLLGETGTGKEIAARGIHALSLRAKATLLTVNMAALNESLAAADLFGAVKGAYTGAQTARKGLFAEADGATLFLDEIGNAPAAVQPMLLRVLENGNYRPLGASQDQHSSARLIAATDQDLYSEHFNQALLRRLECFVIQLPPLRERREDIGVILRFLLQQDPRRTVSETGAATQSADSLGAAITLPFELISAIANHDWPGNIRQLAHAVRRILLALQLGDLGDWHKLLGIAPTHTPQSTARVSMSAPTVLPARKKVVELTEADILAAMDHNDWYIQGAAQELGISRPTMYKLLGKYIRSPEHIPLEDLRNALAQSAGRVEACAALLKTPTEALRRFLRDKF